MITVPFLAEVQRLLGEMFEFVVIDTPPSFAPEVISAVDSSNDVLVVAMRDTLSLKNTKLGLETLERMEYDRRRVKILLNRANTNVGIEREDVLAILGRDVDILRAQPTARSRARSTRASRSPTSAGSEAAKAFRGLAELYIDAARGAQRQPAPAPVIELPTPSRERRRRRGPAPVDLPADAQERVMQLHERLSNRADQERERQDRFAVPFSEMKNRVHMELIEDLGRQLFNTEIDQQALRLRVQDELRERLAQEQGISARGSRADRGRADRRHPRPRSARAPARRTTR